MQTRILTVFAVLLMPLPAYARLDKISNQDATSGLREALVKGSGVAVDLVGKQDANLDNYVTQKALDGLFAMVAEEEKKIRQNPAQAASNIMAKVFGALK